MAGGDVVGRKEGGGDGDSAGTEGADGREVFGVDASDDPGGEAAEEGEERGDALGAEDGGEVFLGGGEAPGADADVVEGAAGGGAVASAGARGARPIRSSL